MATLVPVTCVSHCLTLLRALATRKVARTCLHTEGLTRQLLDYNLRLGEPMRQLLCLLTRNNPAATQLL